MHGAPRCFYVQSCDGSVNSRVYAIPSCFNSYIVFGCVFHCACVTHICIIPCSLFVTFNVYCPECPPGGTIGHPGGQQKKFLPFGHGRDLVAFNGTGL